MRYYFAEHVVDGQPVKRLHQVDGDIPTGGQEVGARWAMAFAGAIRAQQEIDPAAIERAIQEFAEEPARVASVQVNARRDARNRLLLETDWIEFPAAQQRAGPAMTARMLAYRQALFDLDMNGNDWPEKPQ